jgi:hypothetical protein
VFALSAFMASGQGTMIYDQQSETSRAFDYAAPIQEQQPTGQSFTPALSSVGFVQLEFIDAHPGNGLGATVYVNLRADSLSGTILGSTAPVFMPDSFSYGITSFSFGTPVGVNPDTTYYFQPVVQSGDSSWCIINGPYNYSGGTFFANGVPNPNGYDAWFREGSFVPEPSSGVLVLLGIAGMCAARRARRFRTRCQAAVLIGLLAERGQPIAWIRLKNPSGQKVTVKKTISDVSPGNSNRVRTKLARKNSRHFSCIFTHLQKQGVLQQNQHGLRSSPRTNDAMG